VRENPPDDPLDLAVERRDNLLCEIGIKRSAETIVHLLCEVRHPKGAERYSLLDVCPAHNKYRAERPGSATPRH
jgi:hypothetical protein